MLILGDGRSPTAAVRVSQQLPFQTFRWPRARARVEVALRRLLRSTRNCRLPALLSGEIDVQVLPI
jgi:hypothetical protein